MAEEKIFFESEGQQIEGLLEKLPGDPAVVITHPHPLYGGDMYNNVVEAIAQAYREQSYSTLRFNFMGVGQSEGKFDEGMGEQGNVLSAINYLADLGKKNIDLAGYSFGAWVGARGLKNFDRVKRLMMVSPPANSIDFSFLTNSPKLQMVIVGTEDDIAGPKKIETMMPTWNPKATLKIIQGADHFYAGKTYEIKSILHEFLFQER